MFKERLLSSWRVVFSIIALFSSLGCGGSDKKDPTDGVTLLTPVVGYEYEISGDTYYVDAATGDDANPGTDALPFATITHALSVVKGGDGILVRDGDYGDLEFGANGNLPIEVVFEDWVTLKAQEGHRPVLGQVKLGTLGRADNGWAAIPYYQIGNSDLRLRIDGFVISNQLIINGSRHIDVRNCEIRTGVSLYELHTTNGCATFMNGQHIQLLNNDINHCSVGVGGWTTDFVMAGNDIHHCAHDGLKVYGGRNWLVEGNTFRELDDGLDDDDDDPDGRNNHVDGIHIHTVVHGNPEPVPEDWTQKWTGEGRNMVFRGNLFYHIESMAVMINHNDSERGEWEGFLWENNIFGPTNGRLFIQTAAIVGQVFRNNTVLFAPNDEWVSMYGRTMRAEGLGDPGSAQYHLQTWDFGVGQETPLKHDYYNNILCSASADLTQSVGVVANNIFISPENMSELPYEPIPGTIQEYIDEGHLLGILVPGSPAIDASSATEEAPATDIYRKDRDASPDIGAVEYQPVLP